MAADLHPDLEPLAFLIGTWRGEGEGTYPTTEPFQYREEMRFEHVGEAFVLYTQQSWLAHDDSPSHFERGIVRPAGDGRVEFALAHPIGVVEISEGTLEGTDIEVASTSIEHSATADPVTGLVRRYHVEGDVLHYELDMAMQATPMTFHVRGALRRDG